MLKLIITFVLWLTLAQGELSCEGGIPARNPLIPPCQAIYYRYQNKTQQWPAVNRAHQCDMLAWNECAQLTYIHEAYNPEPVAVFSHGKLSGVTGSEKHGLGVIMRFYESSFRFGKTGPPRAECNYWYHMDEGSHHVAWGTDEAQVARLQCNGNMTHESVMSRISPGSTLVLYEEHPGFRKWCKRWGSSFLTEWESPHVL